jgi:choline-sulfatase
MDRRSFLGLSGATALSSALTMGGKAAAEGQIEGTSTVGPIGSLRKRPNIVMFMPDELRADGLACYGNPVTKTPNFDKVAAQGTRFANCHVQFPVCGASRCSLLTGWPTSVRGHRSLQYFLRPEEPNLFRYLKQGGYDVFWYGKNDALAAQTFYGSVTDWNEAGKGNVSSQGYTGAYSGYGLTPGAYSFLYPPQGERRSTYDYALVQSAIEVLKRKEQDKPFCLFLPLEQPHPPYTAPRDFYDMYLNKEMPRLAKADLPKKPSHMAGMRDYYGLRHLDRATFEKIRAVYYGKVSYTDWLLGELMEAMESTGHVEDTALFVLSDHGDYAGDYGLVEKWSSGLEDCLTHVPLMARIPGGVKGHVNEDMVELYDVMKTCLDLAGFEAKHTHFARSLCPQAGGGPGDATRAAFSEGGYNTYEPQCFESHGAPPPGWKSHQGVPLPEKDGGGGPYPGKNWLQIEHPQTITRSAAVRTREHKLIVRPQGQGELYDCVKDPLLENNLYGERGTEELQDQLERKLLYWYVNTTGIAPFDKDQRACPPSESTRRFPNVDIAKALDVPVSS